MMVHFQRKVFLWKGLRDDAREKSCKMKSGEI